MRYFIIDFKKCGIGSVSYYRIAKNKKNAIRDAKNDNLGSSINEYYSISEISEIEFNKHFFYSLYVS